MKNLRAIPESIDALMRDLVACLGCGLSNADIINALNLLISSRELAQYRRLPRSGGMPRAFESFVESVLDPLDRALADERSSLRKAFSQRSYIVLEKWLVRCGKHWRVNRDLLCKQWSAEDYIGVGYLAYDLDELNSVTALVCEEPVLSVDQWEHISQLLVKSQKVAQGKRGNPLLLPVAKAIVSSTVAFNGRPPAGEASHDIARRLFGLLEWVGRSSHRKRFQDEEEDRWIRHQAIMIRAMQYHAGRSIDNARKLYRCLIQFDEKPIAGRFKVDGILVSADDVHATEILRNALSLEVCLHCECHWSTLDEWISELRDRAYQQHDRATHMQSLRFEAEWHLCHLGNANTAYDCHVEAAHTVLGELKANYRDVFDSWFTHEVRKLEAIIQAATGKPVDDVKAFLEQSAEMAEAAGLGSQAWGARFMVGLLPHVDLLVRFAIRLESGKCLLAELTKGRMGQ